jgi:hypothetical protein
MASPGMAPPQTGGDYLVHSTKFCVWESRELGLSGFNRTGQPFLDCCPVGEKQKMRYDHYKPWTGSVGKTLLAYIIN